MADGHSSAPPLAALPPQLLASRRKAPASMKVDALSTRQTACSNACVGDDKAARLFSPVMELGCYEFDRVLKSGDVFKRTRKTKSWKPVHLVLRPQTLCIYADSDGTKLRHRIQLQDVTAVARQRDPKKKARHCFAIFSPIRNFHIHCANDAEAQGWVEMIRSEARITEEEDEAIALMSPSTDRGDRTHNDYLGRTFVGHRPAETAGSTSASEVETSPINIRKSGRRQDTGNMHSTARIPSLGVHSTTEQASYSDFSDTGGLYPESTHTFTLSRALDPEERARQVEDTSGFSSNRPSVQRNTSALSTKYQQNSRSERVVYEGHLLLFKSKRGVRKWKTVWAVLRPRGLAFYKDEDEYQPLHVIQFDSILEAVDLDNLSKNKRHCFQIATDEKVIKFCARDEEEVARWVGGFKSLLAKRREADKDRVKESDKRVDPCSL